MIKVKGLFLFQILLATRLTPKSDKVCQTLGEVEIRIDTEKQKCPPFLHPINSINFIINLFTIYYFDLKPSSGNSCRTFAGFRHFTGIKKCVCGVQGFRQGFAREEIDQCLLDIVFADE